MRDRPTLAPMARSMAAPKARGWGAHQRASCPVRKADNVAYVARKFSLSGTQKGVKPIGGSHVTDRTRWVTTGHNRDDGRSLFCRFLAAAPTHRYAFRLTCSQRVRLLPQRFFIERHLGASIRGTSSWGRFHARVSSAAIVRNVLSSIALFIRRRNSARSGTVP